MGDSPATARRARVVIEIELRLNFKGVRFAVDAEVGEHIKSKEKAETLADEWRTEIRKGTFVRRADQPPAPPTPTVIPETITFDMFTERYIERCEPPVSTNDCGCLKVFARFVIDGHTIGETPIRSLTEDMVEEFFKSLRAANRAVSTKNKFIQAIKAAMRWAKKKGYVESNPLADSDSQWLKRRKPNRRNRRLAPDVVNDQGQITVEGEERRLLAVSDLRLQWLIVGAIEACCRRGELLAVQWFDVERDKREFAIRAVEKGASKTGEPRILPISTRLAGILDMARTAIETTIRSTLPPTASEADVAAQVARCYVFGDEMGRKV